MSKLTFNSNIGVEREGHGLEVGEVVLEGVGVGQQLLQALGLLPARAALPRDTAD